MTMGHGCLEKAVKHFDKKWGCTTIKMAKQHTIRFPNGYLYIDEMYGDCTAATIYSSEFSHERFLKIIPAIIEFLSMNGRITCTFTRSTWENDVKQHAEDLRKFPVIGLHIQQSNREDQKRYQLTGILKIPNPYVRCKYSSHEDNMAKIKHNHSDMTELLELNKKFGFTI